MGRTVTATVAAFLIGCVSACGALAPLTAQECNSIPQVTTYLYQDHPNLSKGLVLKNTTLIMFMKLFVASGGPVPKFSFDTALLFNDTDNTTIIIFFHLNCYQSYIWVPTPLVAKLIKEANG